MNRRNKNNSIIFLTTLSVYLGLVLVGGAIPTVLAQPSLAIKSEIKRNSDFPFLFAQLLNEITKEVENRKIPLPIQNDFYVELNFEFDIWKSGYSRTDFSGGNRDLNFIVNKAIDDKFRAKVDQLASYDSKLKRGKIRFEVSDTYLSIKISFSKLKAKQYADFTSKEFSLLADLEKDFLIKQLYKNTRITSENNQVFIVTRLPRGSLDELFKQDAKADGK